MRHPKMRRLTALALTLAIVAGLAGCSPKPTTTPADVNNPPPKPKMGGAPPPPGKAS